MEEDFVEEADQPVFNARCVMAIASDRKYRIYLRDGEFFLVWIGGPGANLFAVLIGVTFGVIGAVVVALLSRDEASEESAPQDGVHPRDLLAAHKHNFSFKLSDVVDSSIDPPPMFPHGPCVARWQVFLRDGGKWRFELEDLVQTHAAMECLPSALRGTIRVGVRWDEEKKKYVKA